MSHKTFAEALRTALPTLVISDEPSAPTPAGYTPVSFDLSPVIGGVRLSIRIGGAEPYRFDLGSEQEAAAFVGRLADLTY